MLFRDQGKSSRRACLKLRSVTDMEPTLRMDHSRMSPPSASTGSPFILKFSAAAVGRSAHHYSVKGTSAPAHPLTPGLGMNGDRVVIVLPLGKSSSAGNAQRLGQQSRGCSRCFSKCCSPGTVPLLFSQSALYLIAHVKKTE